MAETREPSTSGSRSTAVDTLGRAQNLDELKRRFFKPETKVERIARAVEALRKAKRVVKLDPGALKYIAQHSDLQDD